MKVDCAIFDTQGASLCLEELLATRTLDTIDINCFIGAKKRLSSRLVAVRCCEQEANKRGRHIRRDAKRRWQTPSKKRLQLADWISILQMLMRYGLPRNRSQRFTASDGK
ncbi:MAG: hypothetical protein OXU23_05780 [Candidatus Poribacteria bacterium]|nr:hypothetical protein [Candidatus Poribacteria bacterium]